MKELKKILVFLTVLLVFVIFAFGRTPELPIESPESSDATAAEPDYGYDPEPITAATPQTEESEYIPPEEIVPVNTPLPADMPALGEAGEGYGFAQFYAAAPDAFYVVERYNKEYQTEEGYTSYRTRTALIWQDMNLSEKSTFYDGRYIYFCGITSDFVFFTEGDESYEINSVYMLSRATGKKHLLEEDICGLSLYNPANQTIYYAKNIYAPDSGHRKLLIRAKNLVTGKVTDLFIDEGDEYGSRAWVALFDLAEDHVTCRLYTSYELNASYTITNNLEVTEDVSVWDAEPGTLIEKISDNLVIKAHDYSYYVFSISDQKEEPLVMAHNSLVYDDYLYYIVNVEYPEANGSYYKNFYRIRLNGSGKTLLREATNLVSLFSANGKLYGFACYELEEDEKSSEGYFEKLILHELSADGKPLSSAVVTTRVSGESWGFVAYPAGDIVLVAERGWESNEQHYEGFYDTRTDKFHRSFEENY